MAVDQWKNPEEYHYHIQKKVRETLGKPAKPSNAELNERWKNICKYSQPRTFNYVVDLRYDDVLQSSGMSVLGYADNHPTNQFTAWELVHENQRRLMHYQAIAIYEILLAYPELAKDTGFVYSTLRSIKDKQGKYWLTHQLSTPFQYDEQGYIVKYLSNFRLISEYQGEPIISHFFTDTGFEDEAKRLNNLLGKIKINMLKGIGFTRVQKSVIEHMGVLGENWGEISKQIDMPLRTLEKHRSNILKKGKEIFPLNNFKEAIDVVDYLKIQNIV